MGRLLRLQDGARNPRPQARSRRLITPFADTSVWLLAYRRDAPPQSPEVRVLRYALADGDDVAVTGIVLLELLRGFVPPRAQRTIKAAFAVLEFIEPSRQDYIDAAAISTTCRQHGVQLGTVDSLIAQICISNDLTLLTTDRDFHFAGKHVPLRLWAPAGPPQV